MYWKASNSQGDIVLILKNVDYTWGTPLLIWFNFNPNMDK